MKNLILFFKGLIIGTGQIIPGVSGGMLAISLGLYDKCVEIISSIHKNFKSNIKFLLPIFLGIVTSILLISKIIKISLLFYYVPTMFLFIGLILGAFKTTIEEANIKKNKKYLIISIIITISLSLLSLIKEDNVNYDIKLNIVSYIKLIFVGFTYAFATVVPGISATALMIMLGYYSLIIDIISNLTNIGKTIDNINIIIPLAIGLILGIILISKLMNYLYKKKKTLIVFIILGLVTSSIISMFITTLSNNIIFKDIFIGLIFMFIGYKLIFKINKIK